MCSQEYYNVTNNNCIQMNMNAYDIIKDKTSNNFSSLNNIRMNVDVNMTTGYKAYFLTRLGNFGIHGASYTFHPLIF